MSDSTQDELIERLRKRSNETKSLARRLRKAQAEIRDLKNDISRIELERAVAIAALEGIKAVERAISRLKDPTDVRLIDWTTVTVDGSTIDTAIDQLLEAKPHLGINDDDPQGPAHHRHRSSGGRDD